MELQIQDLVSSIKKEGIEASQKEAEAILAAANQNASDIVAKAKAEAASMKAEAEQSIATLRTGALENAQQAQRDAVLSFKESIEDEFKKILTADIKKTVNGDTLAKLIKAALADEDPSKYVAEVAEVTEGLKSELAAEVKKGLEIKVSPNARSGFRLAAADGSGYFDCSDEEIANMLQPYFSSLNF